VSNSQESGFNPEKYPPHQKASQTKTAASCPRLPTEELSEQRGPPIVLLVVLAIVIENRGRIDYDDDESDD
jgi:hypothetical protein